MRHSRNEAYKKMLGLFFEFEGKPPPAQQHEWSQVEKFVADLSLAGWSRRDIYLLIVEIDKTHADSMPEECADAISNYLTGLVGQVSVQHIVRLPNEAGDEDAHAKYVRSMEWLEN